MHMLVNDVWVFKNKTKKIWNKTKRNKATTQKKHQTQMVKNETEKQVHEFNAHTSTHTPIYIHLKNEEKKRHGVIIKQ